MQRAAVDTRHGTLIAPGLVAPFHSHYFNFRLDLDVDGIANDFMRERLVQQALPEGSPRRSLFAVTPEMPATEQAARTRIEFRLARALPFRQSQCRKRARPSSRLHVMPEGSYVHPMLAARRSAGPAQLLSALSVVGDALCAGPSALPAGRFAMMSDGRIRSVPGPRGTLPTANRDIVAWYSGRLPPHHADGGLAH